MDRENGVFVARLSDVITSEWEEHEKEKKV